MKYSVLSYSLMKTEYNKYLRMELDINLLPLLKKTYFNHFPDTNRIVLAGSWVANLARQIFEHNSKIDFNSFQSSDIDIYVAYENSIYATEQKPIVKTELPNFPLQLIYKIPAEKHIIRERIEAPWYNETVDAYNYINKSVKTQSNIDLSLFAAKVLETYDFQCSQAAIYFSENKTYLIVSKEFHDSKYKSYMLTERQYQWYVHLFDKIEAYKTACKNNKFSLDLLEQEKYLKKLGTHIIIVSHRYMKYCKYKPNLYCHHKLNKKHGAEWNSVKETLQSLIDSNIKKIGEDKNLARKAESGFTSQIEYINEEMAEFFKLNRTQSSNTVIDDDIPF